jgi:peptidoglycan hydrolase CwlO-like protein
MPRTSTRTPSKGILEAALQGLETQKQTLEAQISEVRGLLGRRPGRPAKNSRPAAAASSEAGAKPKRVLSAEARKRIAAAQKKRWAAYRKSS